MNTDALFLAFQEAVAGRYSLQRELGRGGMGVVYLAREVRLDRPVAIKLLPPELAAIPKLRDRFTREARTAARLSHPYIVPIHAVDDAGGFVFYVMAYVNGETLAQRVTSRGPLPPSEATRVLREVAWALAYAHAQGIVHRDIKPANILLERGTERAMVTDFGIARLAHGSGETGVGELLGTPEYMSPEQASGESVDARSDIYSLGIVGYYAVSGSLPFTANTAQAVLAKQITQPAPPVVNVARGLPRALAHAVDCCLAKDPADRIQSGEALADALAPALEKRAEVPVPIRAFLDRRRQAILGVVPGVMLPFAAVAVDRIVTKGPLGGWIVILAMVVGAAIAVPPLIIANRLRPLLRLGYGPDDIAAGLRTMFERRREEFLFEYGPKLSIRERIFGAIGATGLALAGVAVISMLAGATSGWLPPILLITTYIGLISSLLSNRWLSLREGSGSFWAKRWNGVMGRLLTRLASIKLGPRAVLADRPTEVAIALSAQALFDELPKETRKALGDVPAVLRDLETQARAMRARVDVLATTAIEAQSGPSGPDARARQDALVSELRDTRAAAEQRLSDLVTALETLRLDLLRLRAGRGSTESITQDIEAAKGLGEDVDRLIAGAAEVDEALRKNEHSPTPV